MWFRPKCCRRFKRRAVLLTLLCVAAGYALIQDAPMMYFRYTVKMMAPSSRHLATAPKTSLKPSLASYGFTNAKQTWHRCSLNRTRPRTNYTMISLKLENANKSVAVCPIFKIGTTFLKRLFILNTSAVDSRIVNPYEIPYNHRVHIHPGVILANGPQLKVMFSRNPYHRLLSGFVDKLLAPNPVYWKLISRHAIRMVRQKPTAKSLNCGHDLTFSEYVSYVVTVLKAGLRAKQLRDGHFTPMVELCKPCLAKYDFIGKMENFAADSLAVVEMLGFRETRALLQTNGSNLASDDALMDTCHQPFFFRSQFNSCITMHEALERAWRKLRIRGIIGNIKLPVSQEKAHKITQDEFFRLAREARALSTEKDRKLMKESAFIDNYKTVSLADLKEIQKLYKEDFRLFNYDDTPGQIFDRFKDQVNTNTSTK